MRRCCIVCPRLKLVPAVGLFLVLVISAGPAYALLRPYAYTGRVVEKDPESMMITIQTEYTPGSGGWQADSNLLEGEAPNEDAVNEIEVGDEVLATSLGEPGGLWITLGKIASKTIHRGKLASTTEKAIRDLYGDPDYLWDIPLAGGYTLSYDNTPDCDACSGCNCEASYTTVTITDDAGHAESYDLYPEESCSYQDRGRPVDVTFLSGQARAIPECSEDDFCSGVQPVSNFVVHIADPPEDDDDDNCFICISAGTFGW